MAILVHTYQHGVVNGTIASDENHSVFKTAWCENEVSEI